MNVLLVSWAAVPQMSVAIDNEDIFSDFSSEHGESSGDFTIHGGGNLTYWAGDPWYYRSLYR